MNNIVITGASSEIGIAIAKKLISDNHLILHCNQHKDNFNDLIHHYLENYLILNADFRKNEAIELFCRQLNDVDILINVAAITKTDLLVNLQESDILEMIQVNILALTKICRAVIPKMLAKRKGKIINISSIAASRTNRGQSVYGGTKAYIETFTRALAIEYGVKGICANCVAPGAINAGSLKDLLANAPDEIKQCTTSNKLGTVHDIASAVLFLCSDDANFINGQTIHVDGGFLKGI